MTYSWFHQMKRSPFSLVVRLVGRLFVRITSCFLGRVRWHQQSRELVLAGRSGSLHRRSPANFVPQVLKNALTICEVRSRNDHTTDRAARGLPHASCVRDFTFEQLAAL